MMNLETLTVEIECDQCHMVVRTEPQFSSHGEITGEPETPRPGWTHGRGDYCPMCAASRSEIDSRPTPPVKDDLGQMLEDLHGCLRDPDHSHSGFPGGCPAPLRDGIAFTELGGACPMQAAGRAMDRAFSFYVRYGSWGMTIEGACGEHYNRHFRGEDRWDGWMPPSVAFALVTSKLLWHVCVPALDAWPRRLLRPE